MVGNFCSFQFSYLVLICLFLRLCPKHQLVNRGKVVFNIMTKTVPEDELQAKMNQDFAWLKDFINGILSSDLHVIG